MSPNVLRFIFARTFRGYPISTAPVKAIRLIGSIPCKPCSRIPRTLLTRRADGEAPNLERPFPRAQPAGAADRPVGISRANDDRVPGSAMDCSVWLTVRPRRTDCRTDPLRSSQRLGQIHPPAKPCHCYQSCLLYHAQPGTANGHGWIDDTRRREAASEENGAKLLKSLCLGAAV